MIKKLLVAAVALTLSTTLAMANDHADPAKPHEGTVDETKPGAGSAGAAATAEDPAKPHEGTTDETKPGEGAAGASTEAKDPLAPAEEKIDSQDK